MSTDVLLAADPALLPLSAPPVKASAEAATAASNRHRHGRGRIPDTLAREEVPHDLTEAEKTALGGVEDLVELPGSV